MPNIRELAHRANVSVATASRVLNNNPNVSQATKLMVLRAAHEIGYPIARVQNAPQLSRSVLVLTRDLESPNGKDIVPADREFDRMVWTGVHSVLEKHQIATLLQRSRMQVEDAQHYSNDIGVSALVLLGGIVNHDFVHKLIDLKVPFVIVGAHLHPLEVNVVMADVFRGMQLSVQHLIENGRRCIGLVNGPLTTTTSEEKYTGLRLALTLNKLPFHPTQVISGDFTPEDGYKQTLTLIQNKPDLDAIIYADDRMALGGLRALKEKEKSIPRDVSVTSFGNYEIARFTDPPLTTVMYDMHAMGAIAGQRICSLLAEPDDQSLFILTPVSLIVRESG